MYFDYLGALITVKGQVVFTSQNTITTEVVVEYEHRLDSFRSYVKGYAVDAYFTFVSINDQRKVQKVPQLKVSMYCNYKIKDMHVLQLQN